MIANLGLKQALQADEFFAMGLNTYNGYVTNKNVADALNKNYTPVKEAIQ